MAEPSIDEIESLLREIEAAGGSTTRPRASKGAAATTTAAKNPPQGACSPGGPQSRISFSTYLQQESSFSCENDDGTTPQPQRIAPPAGKKLAPLGGAPPSSDAAFASKAVLGDVSPSSRKPISAADKEDDSNASAEPRSLVVEPNFLPVMHARFVQGTGGITPKPRWGHSLTSVGGSMLMFGGALGGEGSATSDFFELLPSPTSVQWEPAFSAKGAPPSPRMMHAAASYLDKFLVIAGGCGTNYANPTSDVHIYDTVAQSWTVIGSASQPQSGMQQQRNEPTGRYGHSLVIHGDAAYVFGGKCLKKTAEATEGKASSHILSSDVFVFKLGKMQWKKRLRDESKSEDDGNTTAPSSNWPARRFCHAAVMHRGEMFIHGGEGSHGQLLSDTWAFSAATKTWRCVHAGLDAVPRSRHVLFACGEALLAVGGCSLHVPPNKNETFLAVLPLLLPPGGAPVGVAVSWLPVTLANSNLIPAAKKLFGAALYRGFVFTFGGVAGADGASNHLVRFLAADGVQLQDATGEPSVPLLSQMLRLREKQRSVEDLALSIRGHTIGAHKFVLQLRAPKLLEDILRCRSESEHPTGGSATYQLVGNSRVRGLEVSTVTAEQMEALIAYLYSGTLPDVEEEAAAVAGLQELAAAYKIEHLATALSARGEAAMAMAAHRSLVVDLQTLLSSGTGANATLLFVDPHTERQVVHSAHTSIIMNSSELFSQLLKPIVGHSSGPDASAKPPQQSNVVNGITATLGRSSSSKRGIIIGPVPIPSLAVRHILRFLYTAELDVPPEAALPTMMAAFTLKLPRLQAHCESIIAREEVNFSTCCDFLSLAISYQAPMLEELSLLTAGVGFSEVSKQQPYQSLDASQKQRIDRIGLELRGHWVAPAAPVTEQKSPSRYAARMQSS
jgi:hypothetical protein